MFADLKRDYDSKKEECEKFSGKGGKRTDAVIRRQIAIIRKDSGENHSSLVTSQKYGFMDGI